MRRRPLTAAGILLAAVAALVAGTVFSRTPRLERPWVEHLAVLPEVRLGPEGFAVGPVIDWSYDRSGPTAKESTAFAAAYADLRRVWFVLEPQPGGDYAAHTLVLFEFAGDRIVGLTVEARREADEDYDPLLGLFNTYELSYVWATARELLNRRAVYLRKEVYVYPLELTREQQDAFLRSVLRKTREVAEEPRFYNTLTSNCTNELAKAAGLGWHYSWILTGHSPERLFELGFIPARDLASATAGARLTRKLREWNALPGPEYDRALLRELRARRAAQASIRGASAGTPGPGSPTVNTAASAITAAAT